MAFEHPFSQLHDQHDAITTERDQLQHSGEEAVEEAGFAEFKERVTGQHMTVEEATRDLAAIERADPETYRFRQWYEMNEGEEDYDPAYDTEFVAKLNEIQASDYTTLRMILRIGHDLVTVGQITAEQRLEKLGLADIDYEDGLIRHLFEYDQR